MPIDPQLLEILRCPVSRQPLQAAGRQLVTADGSRRYRVVQGIPCLIPEAAEPTHYGYSILAESNDSLNETPLSEPQIDDFLNGMIVPTCGNLFKGVKLRGRYPIPQFPSILAPGRTLEVGCNWGRWTISGANAGHAMVGIDVHLESLLVAQRLAQRLSPQKLPQFVLGDARWLPFVEGAFDNALSYSVLQHFSRPNCQMVLNEVRRVLADGGQSAIQMPNRDGLKAILTMPKRRFAEGRQFDVRYYSVKELIHKFSAAIGPSDWLIDCFLGLNVHAKDQELVPMPRRLVIYAAEALKAVAKIAPPLARLSDSVWITSRAI